MNFWVINKAGDKQSLRLGLVRAGVRVVGAENLCQLGRFAGKRLGSGPAPGGRWAGLHPAVRAMIFGL